MAEHVKKKGFSLQVEKVYEKKKFDRKTKDFYGTRGEKKSNYVIEGVGTWRRLFDKNDGFTARRVYAVCVWRYKRQYGGIK